MLENEQESKTINTSRDKELRLIEYLTGIARINAKITRDLEEYRNVLWIHSIPHEAKYCYTKSWGEEYEHGDDIWVEVKKFPQPLIPKVPDKCLDWVDQKILRNTEEIPELRQSIKKEIEYVEQETGDIITEIEELKLADYPEVKKEWEVYLDKQWLPWTELHGRYEKVQRVYGELFHIYQEQQKLGEQYELVLCLGLLTWKTPTGHSVRRHVISAKASLEFEPHLGKFIIRPAIDNDYVDVELDMLDIETQPQNAMFLIENGRKLLQDNLWERASLDAVLTSIANSLADSGQGEYDGKQLEPKEVSPTSNPLVEYAPAIILRKRSMKGLEYLLEKMREQIRDGVIAPHEFLDLSENIETSSNQEQSPMGQHSYSENSEIYFPLPANEEQKRIIRILDKQNGVIVQGPPGTGKSHTIANLICHLLATGRRVLVTAKTPRALQVLGDKLPDEIKPLCINLLGGGVEERESLEKSVAGMLLRLDRREEMNVAQQIQFLENRIHSNRSTKAETDKKLMAIRESETYVHSIADGIYNGTAAVIARRINKEKDTFSWFEDKIRYGDALPISQNEIISISNYLVNYNQELENQMSYYIPDPIELPDCSTVKTLFRNENLSREKIEASTCYLQSLETNVITQAGKENIEQLCTCLLELTASIESVCRRPMKWIAKAVYDVLSDRDTPWKELLRLSKESFKGLREASVQVDILKITIPEGIDSRKLLHDAKAIKTHFNSGGGQGFWIFKSKAIREHGSFIDNVTVDGIKCTNAETLEKLINYLTFVQKLDYIWSLWSDKTERHNGPFPLQIAEIDELHEALESIVQLYEIRERPLGCINKIRGLSNPRWEDTNALYELIGKCQAILAQIELLNIQKEIQIKQDALSGLDALRNIHSIVKETLQAFIDRDTDLYARKFDKIKELRAVASLIKANQEILTKLGVLAPHLVSAIRNNIEKRVWAEQLRVIDKAWAWARAKSWLEDFLNSNGESLERHSKSLEEDIRRDLASLASIRAWDFCFDRMQEEHRRHLMGWQQSMKKLGKGTGKHAQTHRQNAQRHLNECRVAVPAWVMPLHRVYETVEAGPGIFDVIIVDEASQCGPESLPLLYLGKRILVVGDDKQISPEAVGIGRDHVQRLMRDYLYDFDHADSFDVENSLFDHGRIRFSNRITLREHFRCMPEIIQFSNDLCYRTDPLIPLRQYPPDRMEPLKRVFISNGYRQGDGQRVINRPEAEAVVDTIAQCCKDEQYQGMTMGVIALQGEAQAYLIEDLLLKAIGAEEMQKRRIICGNPYTFQGDERNIIFLTMVSAPNERIGVLTQASDQRRFNVAASRAQEQMWLFHSVNSNNLSHQCLRARLLDYFSNPQSTISMALGESAEELQEQALRANRSIERAPSPFGSWFEVDVALHIAGRGYRLVPQFKFADKFIDLVVQGNESQLAVECDGDYWHGIDEYADDMERQRKLERCGWSFFRIRESSYYSSPGEVMAPLWDLLKKMGIFSISEMDNLHADENEDDADNGDDYSEDVGEESNKDYYDDSAEEPSDPSGSTHYTFRTVKDEQEVPAGGINDALKAKPAVIRKAIIEVLEERPKNSCVKEKMPAYILKRWNIITRGKPRDQFASRVDEQIAIMSRKGHVIVYKSKNVRVKMGWVEYSET